MQGGGSKSLMFSADVMAGCQTQVAGNINITQAIYRVQCTVKQKIGYSVGIQWTGDVVVYF